MQIYLALLTNEEGLCTKGKQYNMNVFKNHWMAFIFHFIYFLFLKLTHKIIYIYWVPCDALMHVHIV